MSSSPATTTTTQQTSTSPWSQAQPYFQDLYSAGKTAMDKSQALPIPQQYVAGANPTQLAAVNQAIGLAPTLGASGGALSDMASKIASGYFLNPMNDPTFAGAAAAALQPGLNQLTQQILPTNIGNAIKTGGTGAAGPSAYGGSSLALDTEKILQDYGLNAQNTVAAMANNSRNAGMNLIPQAPGLATAANTQLLAPSTALGAAGTALQGFTQQDINNILQQYQGNQAGYWNGIQPMTNLLTAGGYNQGSQVGTSTTPPPSMATQILQGLTGGAGILGSLFSAPAGGTSAIAGLGSTLGSMGTTLGGLGSSIAGALPFVGI